MSCFKFILIFLVFAPCLAQTKNGFDLSNSVIPVSEIKQGGPPRDGIPSIDEPVFVGAGQTELGDSSRILGVSHEGISKAYPINILNYHEVVNDNFKGIPVVITYCPLCGSGLAFSAEIEGKIYEFGVSGLLYNSDVLLYDRQTASLWSQLQSRAISGPMVGEKLRFLPTANTTWGQWKKQHPKTLVLSEKTGFSRNYAIDPYPGYLESRSIFFPVSSQSDLYHPKENIIGVEINGKFKAYPFSELKRTEKDEIKDSFQNEDLVIKYDPESNTAEILDELGKPIPAVTSFWFAWFAFHPETEIFKADGQ